MSDFFSNIPEDVLFQAAQNCKEDFLSFVEEELGTEMAKNCFSLPFALLFGLLWSYFKSQGIDLDLNNLSPDETTQYLIEEIRKHEKVISHFS